jgi:hypothetical protein
MARVENLNTSGTTLGDSNRMEFLALTGFDTIDAAFEAAKVEYVSKRAMLVNIGGVLYMFGRYGLSVCSVPSGIDIDCLSVVQGPSLLSHNSDKLLERLGAVNEKYDRGDWIRDYTPCKAHLTH